MKHLIFESTLHNMPTKIRSIPYEVLSDIIRDLKISNTSFASLEGRVLFYGKYKVVSLECLFVHMCIEGIPATHQGKTTNNRQQKRLH